MNERGGEALSADRLRELLQELSNDLEQRGQSAQLFVVGGAAMALAYDSARVTRDVDALFVPTQTVRDLSEELGSRHGLESDWINDGAKGFMPGPDEDARTVFESESLQVQVASPEYLLAMKIHAGREERDLEDAAKLFRAAGYTSADQAVQLLEEKYPANQLLPRHRYIAEDVASRAAAAQSQDRLRDARQTLAETFPQWSAGPRDAERVELKPDEPTRDDGPAPTRERGIER